MCEMIRTVAFLVCAAAGQSRFEVASIKTAVVTPERSFTPLTGGPRTASPTRFTGPASMKELLTRAFG